MKTKLITVLVAGSLVAIGATAPAFAGSPLTEAFAANAQPNIDFLDSSSRLAIATSANPRIRAFARSEATEQTITANSFVAWTQTDTAPRTVVATVDGPLGPVDSVVTVPLDVATNVTTNVTNGVGDVLTGRSVAIDNPIAPVVQPVIAPAPAPLLSSGDQDMDRLSALKGRQFDALYVSTQADALRQLATLYADYIRNGDDAGLRALAVAELPKINHRLAELRRL